MLLDALDEVPSTKARLVMRTLIENAVGDYDKCRFIVTSRPAAFVGDVVLAGFEQARIAPLEDEAIEAFLGRWCLALADHNEADAKEHLDELLIPLRKLPEVRRMARNPVMLTALAVVHWNEKRLPEQRAELYESIIGWLAKQRPHSEGRPKPEQCVALLQNLALAMQDHPKGRQTQVTRHWGARAIAPSFREVPEDERVSAAERFLSEEEVDSGIIVGRGEHEIRFWHLTFQEYLAARGLAAQKEKVQAETLLATDKLYAQEWREVVLLMAGVLHRQGIERVDGMFETMLEKVGPKAPLKAKARCAGLLNAILGDLGPVGYKPDNERYAAIVRDAMAVFDAKRSKGIPIKVAIEAAEARDEIWHGDGELHDPASAVFRFRAFGSATVPFIGERLCAVDCSPEEMLVYGNILREVGCDLPRRTRERFATSLSGAKAEDRAKALATLKKAVKAAPTSAHAWCSLGQNHAKAGETRKAIHALRRSLKLDPGQAGAWNALGLVVAQKGQPQEAREILEQGFSLVPDAPDLTNSLGVIAREAGALDDSIRFLEKAVTLAPRSALTLSNLGVSLADAGRFEDALVRFEAALALDDGNSEAWRAYAKP
ncbi:MAG: tetratricopeptide repeat protein, partial [Planctomycetes bacterium]|nr:tetratricopeptide repeat protein [Planctomycetota bacterium]